MSKVGVFEIFDQLIKIDLAGFYIAFRQLHSAPFGAWEQYAGSHQRLKNPIQVILGTAAFKYSVAYLRQPQPII